jgi:RNA polymerase sigma-70 factor, ECF subfamily
MSWGSRTRERRVGETYAAHAVELYGFAVRSLGDAGLAEEVVQETFLRAWRTGDGFEPAAGTIRKRLFAILCDLLRDRAAPLQVAEGGVEAPVEHALLTWQIEEAMRRIGEQHRRILLETYFGGRSFGQVAADLGLTEGTVRSRAYDALRALRVVLEELELEH